MNRLQAHHLPAAVGRVRATIRAGDPDTRTDPDLLERYARYGDHPAFEAILRRHGPMVLGVCRRMLGNAADADDAFQATFLVLIRRVRSVRGERLGPWLYGVAFRVALKARGRVARAAARQTEVTDMIPDPTSPADPPDWLPILDAELNALPAKYREPMVLCEIQGATRADAATALGIPEGTLSSRLARGRQLLRKKLMRHGTLLPVGGLAALLGAGSSGRATVPAGLHARTAELATPGADATGVVSAGTARLTDEVVKEMLLTKLRMTGGTVLATGLLVVGLLAAWPAAAPGQPETPKPGAKAVETPPGPKKSEHAGPARPDREALQGLWVLEKVEVGKTAPGETRKEVEELIGKMRILVAGDVWWAMGGRYVTVTPHKATLDPAKNPKWADLDTGAPRDGALPSRCIYQLDGDHLRICVAGGDHGLGREPRPAEFSTEDDSPLILLHLRRDPLPASAGEKRLLGSWEGVPGEIRRPNGEITRLPGRRVEILDGFLFILLPKDGYPDGVWVGGRYTVDTTKNPKWIDVDLVGAYPNEKVTKLHGSYEAEDGRVKLTLGLIGQRAFRPLDLSPAPGSQADNLFFELRPATTSLIDRPKDAVPVGTPDLKRIGVPTGTELPTPQPRSEAPPSVLLGIRGGDATAALDRAHPQARELMKVGKFAEAEAYLRTHLRSAPDGPAAGTAKLLLGVCLLQRADPRAGSAVQDPMKARQEALGLFKQLADDRDGWLRTQARLRVLQTYHQLGQPQDVLTFGDKFRQEVAGTADELILLSLMYHAHKQQDNPEGALAIRGQMRDVFEKLKAKPNAFPEKTGEYSREYWEKVWFAP
ncbi:MAG: sigE 29 [Gemmataceae bacterium]|nr:sigE 29 [Gemmataceae bacterium]